MKFIVVFLLCIFHASYGQHLPDINSTACCTSMLNSHKLLELTTQSLQAEIKELKEANAAQLQWIKDHVNDCPPLFQKFKGSCYLMVLGKLSWSNAEKRCKDMHPAAHLATVESADVDDYLTDYFTAQGGASGIFTIKKGTKDAHQAYWIGGYEPVRTRKWQWIGTGMALKYSHWNPGQPNYNSAKNCIAVTPPFNGWSDSDCNAKFPYACEVKL